MFAVPKTDNNGMPLTVRECEEFNAKWMRSWIAGQILSGICASGPTNSWTDDMLCAEAVKMADAMMRRLDINV